MGNFGQVGIEQLTFGPGVFLWFFVVGAVTVAMSGGLTRRPAAEAPAAPIGDAEPATGPAPSTSYGARAGAKPSRTRNRDRTRSPNPSPNPNRSRNPNPNPNPSSWCRAGRSTPSTSPACPTRRTCWTPTTIPTSSDPEDALTGRAPDID